MLALWTDGEDGAVAGLMSHSSPGPKFSSSRSHKGFAAAMRTYGGIKRSQHNTLTTTTQQQHNNNTTTTRQQHNNNTTATQQQHDNNTTTTQQQMFCVVLLLCCCRVVVVL
jgi:hypothetical protein